MSNHECQDTPAQPASNEVPTPESGPIFLYPSGDACADVEVKATLENNPGTNVVIAPEGRLLKDWFVLPMAEDPLGDRYFGVGAVQRCLEDNSRCNVYPEE